MLSRLVRGCLFTIGILAGISPACPGNETPVDSTQEDRLAVADSVFQGIRDEILDDLRSHDSRLSLEGFLRHLKNADGSYRVGIKQRNELWDVFCEKLAPPPITISELASLILATRESIVSCRTVSVCRKYSSAGETGKTVPSVRVEAIRSEGRFLRRNHMLDPAAPVKAAFMSYDGEVVRQYSATKDTKHGSIALLQSRDALWDLHYDVLALSMHCDTVAELGFYLPCYNLAEMLKKEHKIAIMPESDGKDASPLVRIGHPGMWVVCDPDKSFAVTKFQLSGFASDFRSDQLVCRYTLSDHVELEPGVWLPKKLKVENFARDAENAVSSIETVDVEKIEVNKNYDNEVFRDLIPDGVGVVDSVRNVTYVTGNPSMSIEDAVNNLTRDLLKPVAPKSSAFRYALFTINIVIVAAIATVLVRRQRVESQ